VVINIIPLLVQEHSAFLISEALVKLKFLLSLEAVVQATMWAVVVVQVAIVAQQVLAFQPQVTQLLSVVVEQELLLMEQALKVAHLQV
jgi:hypothetical protein